MYNFITALFSTIGPIAAPAWFISFIAPLIKYFVIANYFIPLGTFFSVAISCISFHIFISGIVIVLDIF